MKLVFPIAAGILATIIAGFLLLPVVLFIFDNFFEFYLFQKPPNDYWKNRFILGITICIWFFVASAVGGYFCSLVSEKKEHHSITLFIIVAFVISLIFSAGEIITDFEIETLLPILCFIVGTYTGNFISLKKKRGKLKNSLPSPAE